MLLAATTLGTGPGPGDDRGASTPRACADRLCRAVAEAGLTGLLAAPPWALDTLPELVAVAATHGLAVASAIAPLAPGPLPAGKRLPHLAAFDDREELLAAVALARRSLDALSGVGAHVLALELGRVALAAPESVLHEAFARGELAGGLREHPVLSGARAERQARSARVLDAARSAIERLSKPAERAGVTLALRVAGSLWAAPSPREALALCDDLGGAPLAVATDSGAWAALERLGLTAGPERLRALLRRSALLLLHDAVGLDVALAPGLGEASARWPSELPTGQDLPATALPAIGGRPDTRRGELLRAREVCAPWLRARAPDFAASRPPSGG